ncbi:general secretion pathway protein GspH [Vibrio metoecus]|nr:general secretion pathway protein GspH [Vibrio metoecus]PAR59654.1 general secretion pathway protein GspH [Vibrio metoecus]
MAQVGFCVFLNADLVERVESSAVSKPLKANKPRCFKVVGCSTLSTWFHKKQHRR